MILTLCERLDLDQSGKDIILASKEDWVWMESVLSSLGQSSSSERKQLEYLPMGNTPSSKKSGIDFSSPLSNQHGSSKMKSPSSSPARKTTKSPSSTPSTIQYALKTRPFLGDPSPVPIDDFRGNQTQRSFRSPSAASNTTRSPVASASSKSSAKQQSTPKAALQSYTSHRQQSDDKSPFEADVYVVAEFTKSTSPSSKLIKKASPSAAKSRPRISFQNREVVPLQPHELQEEGPPRSAQASPNRPSKSTTNSPQKQCELAMLSSMDPIRRELFRRLSNSPEKRRSTAAASSTTTEEATFVQIPTARTVIPFGSKRKHPQHKIEEEQDEGFIQIPKFASAPTKTSSSPARQTLPTIEFGQGDSKKVFVHPNASASIDSEPEYLSEDSESEDSDVAVIAEIKLVPSASELLKSPSPKKPSQQKTNLPSAAKQSPHHSTSSPNKRPAPSSPSKSPLAKKKQKMVSFKDIRPIQANGIEYFNTAILDSSIYSLASWEDLIISVDVIAPTEDPILDHAGIIVCTKWKDGSHVYTSLEDGKLKFPVKMVEYYEKFVTFGE